MPLKVPWARRSKPKSEQEKKIKKRTRRSSSFFSDHVINEFSVAQCGCELYFPEPSLVYDEFGTVKDVCISGDSVTLLWSKHCQVHLCEVPNISPDSVPNLQDTGQELEVCLNVVLNKSTTGELNYSVRDKHWHECSIKTTTSARWHRFVLQLVGPEYEHFEQKLENTLQLIQENQNPSVYLLVAVQTKLEKRQSLESSRHQTRLSYQDLPKAVSQTSVDADDTSSGIATLPRSSTSEESLAEEDEEDEEEVFSKRSQTEATDETSQGGAADSPRFTSLTPPFDPAPYIPDPDTYEERFQSSVEELKKSTNFTSLLCDSLHIHPNELPQTLESILKSAVLTESIRLGNSRRPISKVSSGELRVIKRNSSENSRRSSSRILDSNDDCRLEARSDSAHLTSEELYLPMGAVKPQEVESKQAPEKMAESASAKMNVYVQKAQRIADLLTTAINQRDVVKAQEYAKQLVEEQATVSIEAKLQPNKVIEENQEFNLKVSVEDKEVSGGNIMLKVKATNTIRDLKNMMLLKHQFPVEVQYWIIGKRIPQDGETLYRCKVREPGCTAYLYLVSAKSVGVDRNEFLRKQAMLQSYPDLAQATVVPDPGAIPAMQAGAGALTDPPASGSTTAGSRKSFPTPGSSAPDGKNKLTASIGKDNFNFNTPKENDKLRKSSNEKLPIPVDEPGGRLQGAATGWSPGGAMAMVPNIAPVGTFERFGHMFSREPIEVEEEPQNYGWACPACTFLNQPTRPGCEVCANPRPLDYAIPEDYEPTEEERQRLAHEVEIERRTQEAQALERQLQQQQSQRNFQYLQETDNQGLVPNPVEFQCPICFDDIPRGEGVVLRECLHSFCKDCLGDAVLHNENPVLTCPYTDEEYTCDASLLDREVKALVTPDVYNKYLARSLSTAESQAANSFHCKSADCPGWCIYEDLVNFFVCQVCGKENCLTCKAIHEGMNCKQYQEDLKLRAVNDKAANQTQIMIRKMMEDGDAMNCPQCQVIVMKKEGCDWIQCSICKTEICWVTKGPRWGPLGNGDISGGCQCRVNGQVCHPECNNCH